MLSIALFHRNQQSLSRDLASYISADLTIAAFASSRNQLSVVLPWNKHHTHTHSHTLINAWTGTWANDAHVRVSLRSLTSTLENTNQIQLRMPAKPPSTNKNDSYSIVWIIIATPIPTHTQTRIIYTQASRWEEQRKACTLTKRAVNSILGLSMYKLYEVSSTRWLPDSSNSSLLFECRYW